MAQFAALSTDSFARQVVAQMDLREHNAIVVGCHEANEKENRFWICSRGEYYPRYMRGKYKEVDPNLRPEDVAEQLTKEHTHLCEKANQPSEEFVI